MKDDGSEAHDPDFPPRFVEFMRTGWGDSPIGVTVRPEAPLLAKRRAAVAAAFAGETLVIPTGRERTRSNDTGFLFRPGSDHAWLTGDHDPDSVLVVRPDGEAVLFARPRSPRDSDEFFRNRAHGELWVGRRHTLAEKSAELGVDTADLAELPGVLDD